jgi:predicted RNA-binding protein with PUA-like domain
MQIGDTVLFYHSNCKVPGIAGLARVVSLPHPDMTQFVPGDKHYDPKSTHERVIWQCIDVGFVEKFSDIISLTDLRSHPDLSTMKILQKGNRLSITPVTDDEYNIICSLIV